VLVDAVREVVGATPLLAASFDLHGNFSQRMAAGGSPFHSCPLKRGRWENRSCFCTCVSVCVRGGGWVRHG
jgi:hypothetical protein